MQNREFYSVAAQVIPLLFLALVFEYRYLDPRAFRGTPNPLVQLTVLAALGAGELAALHALYTRDTGDATRVLTIAGLAVPGFMVWFSAVLAVLIGLEERLQRPGGLSSWVRLLVVALQILIPFAFVAVLIYALLQVV